jgi:hypothetical protein
MDVAVGGLILALVSFLAGTIAPAIYARLAHSGISIRAVGFQVGAPIEATTAYYALIIKAANATGRSVLLDDVRINPFEVHGVTYRPTVTQLVDVTGRTNLVVPTSRDEDPHIDVLPLVLKSDEARVYILEATLRGDAPHGGDFFVEDFETVSIDFRINGIYRNFRVDPSRRQPFIGYTVDVDTRPESLGWRAVWQDHDEREDQTSDDAGA